MAIKETNLPSDHDGVKDRYNDIRYSDKTKYDEKVALLVSDYLELSKQIRNIAINNFKNNNEKAKFERELDHFLKNTNTKSTLRSGEERKYDALIRGSFEITNVIRIERQDNSDNISSKFADFTSETIEDLIKQGEKDTLNTFKKSENRS